MGSISGSETSKVSRVGIESISPCKSFDMFLEAFRMVSFLILLRFLWLHWMAIFKAFSHSSTVSCLSVCFHFFNDLSVVIL